MTDLPLNHLFVLLFMMTGPLKAVPTFAAMTAGMPADARAKLARRGILIAMVALVLAVFLGHGIMKSWGASPYAVGAAAGLLLSIASLQAILGFGGAPAAESGDRDRAVAPLAFPTLVPPYAVGVLILFAAHFTETTQLLQIAGLAVGMMVLDWFALTFADQILRVLGTTVLRVLGSVFGVLQLSLGIEMILYALKGGA